MGQLVCGYPQKGCGGCVAAPVMSGLEKSMKNPSRVYEISSDLQAVYSDE